MGLIRVQSKHVVFKKYHTRQFESQDRRCMSIELRDHNMKSTDKFGYLHTVRERLCHSIENYHISHYTVPVWKRCAWQGPVWTEQSRGWPRFPTRGPVLPGCCLQKGTMFSGDLGSVARERVGNLNHTRHTLIYKYLRTIYLRIRKKFQTHIVSLFNLHILFNIYLTWNIIINDILYKKFIFY